MHADADRKSLHALALAALGVVFGDIGTSPLYAMKEVFSGTYHAVPITPDNILGILSLIVWSLILVVSVKYAAFIMRADNQGEGGILALLALVQRQAGEGYRAGWLVLLGLFGAALFYGDGVITPAISVLSAVEGLEVVTPVFKPWVLPITIAVLFGLFLMQRQGTGKVGSYFGPVTMAWFLALAALGVSHIAQTPGVLAALSPHHAARFFATDPVLAFFSLGAVFLTVTGAETLYADMGHFGARPVRLAWLVIVLPALILNYFGQGALLLAHPEAIAHPFYHLAPDWALVPLVLLATAATVIASQAVISGVYSITAQAIQLGYVPRMLVMHTSSAEHGQVYLPGINWGLFLAVAILVLGFGSSGALASAYGISVSGTMVITTVLVYIVARRIWRWPASVANLFLVGLLSLDLAFFTANLGKIADGGWFPMTFALAVFLLMTTWRLGRQRLRQRRDESGMPLDVFATSIRDAEIPVIPGTAVFLTPNPDQVPHALLHSLKHYKSLHERVIILNVRVVEAPYVSIDQRVAIRTLGGRLFQVEVRFGFMDRPDLTETLHVCASKGMACRADETSFFLGRETLIAHADPDYPLWRQKLFIAMSRNAGSLSAYFNLPVNRVVELGAQVVL